MSDKKHFFQKESFTKEIVYSMYHKKATKIAVIATALLVALIFSASVMPSTETTDSVMVKNARAIPPVIAVNCDITSLQVDVACINSSIDLVKIDLSPIGGNVSTIMALIGNFTEGYIEWYSYNCSTNASVEGSFNLSVNATDITGNYNNSVNIMLEVNGNLTEELELIDAFTVNVTASGCAESRSF